VWPCLYQKRRQFCVGISTQLRWNIVTDVPCTLHEVRHLHSARFPVLTAVLQQIPLVCNVTIYRLARSYRFFLKIQINLEGPRENEMQATRSQNSRDILAHWKTFPPIVGKQTSHL